ncbi:unnamed protein product [Ilex paraguariensis]|uniref:Uncharacterized protein n=1 Tax=Ilex paraguariensis TaxID=185542 RepID=A0ABC8SHS8_9AQUA
MDAQHHQKTRDKVEEKQIIEGTSKQKGIESQQAKPPSASSSPTHEFSFTVSLHPEATRITDKPMKAKPKAPPSFAIDLSPADDIFFHGHFLPLHFLSHLPLSPRSSSNSLDSFTLPIRDLVEDQNPENICTNSTKITTNTDDKNFHQSKDHGILEGRTKPKSFSLFFGLQKWRKGQGCEVREKEEKQRQKKKLKLDVTHILKRYVRIVRPLLSFIRRSGRRNMKYAGKLIHFPVT